MNSIFLTQDEIETLTGRKLKSSQMTALQFMGIEHKVRPDGSIVVLRAHIEKIFDGVIPSSMKAKTEPNWDFMNAS